MEFLLAALIVGLFGLACYHGPCWLIAGLQRWRRPVTGRVLRAPVEDFWLPNGRRLDRYALVVEVNGRVRKVNVTDPEIWAMALPGQQVALRIWWGTVTEMEVLRRSSRQSAIAAQRRLKEWRGR